MVKLTPKQELFVREYLIDFNGTRAAIAAGYSEDSARQIGSENLSKPYIVEAIASQAKERTESAEITTEYVLKTIKSIADDCANKIEDTYQPQVALKGLELLGKYLKLFTDKVEHTGKDGEELFKEQDPQELARRTAFILSKPQTSDKTH